MDDGEVLKTLWPITQRGSVLVTAQNAASSFSPAQTVHRLRPLSTEAGSELMQQIIADRTIDLFTAPSLDKESALELAYRSGGLPLAITQMAVYVLTVNCTLQDFVAIYEERCKKGFSMDSLSGFVDFRYEHNMETVWNLAFAKMDERSSRFQEIISFLDPDHIPELLFDAGKNVLDVAKIPAFPYSKAEYVYHAWCQESKQGKL